MNRPSLAELAKLTLQDCGADRDGAATGPMPIHSPIDGSVIGAVAWMTPTDIADVIARSHEAFLAWRQVPAPNRGELLRLFAAELRRAKTSLGRLISIETGKIATEGLGEVQEMIDICDFAVGLSRQLYGLTIASERKFHRMMESWHPLGVVGVISAFNFPAAVWSWNAALALVCGNAVVWKPSEKTPLTALAVQALFERAAQRCRDQGAAVPEGLNALILGDREAGEALVDDPRVPLVSATGSTAMGRVVGQRLAKRFARAILELGGNNAGIVCPSADLELTLRAVAFSAMGTAGQRCTSLRRLFVHDHVYRSLIPRLKAAYASVPIGNPLLADTLVGPLIDADAYARMMSSLEAARLAGGLVTGGERVVIPGLDQGYYLKPALVEMPSQCGPVREETFAPILYVLRYDRIEDAIAMQNDVGAGLSSSIFTTDLREAEMFLSTIGSDCGIANVNLGTSGAEIGGAFGGEKETGGGRESGTDSWRAYMRRATNTINFGASLPLAQGVNFDFI